MAIGDQNHRCIAMTTSAHLAGSVHELLDLALGEIAASNCEVFSAWCAAIGYLICHGKSRSCKYDWKNNRLFLHRWELGIYKDWPSTSTVEQILPRQSEKKKEKKRKAAVFCFSFS